MQDGQNNNNNKRTEKQPHNSGPGRVKTYELPEALVERDKYQWQLLLLIDMEMRGPVFCSFALLKKRETCQKNQNAQEYRV